MDYLCIESHFFLLVNVVDKCPYYSYILKWVVFFINIDKTFLQTRYRTFILQFVEDLINLLIVVFEKNTCSTADMNVDIL